MFLLHKIIIIIIINGSTAPLLCLGLSFSLYDSLDGGSAHPKAFIYIRATQAE
jgi:hypothetical protein